MTSSAARVASAGERCLPGPHSDAAVSFSARGLLRGGKRALPLVLSVGAYGLVFGVLARQAGISVGEAVLMSGLVFAGSAQVIALGMWATPLPVVSLILTTLVVNLRHLLMGAVLHPRLGRLSAPRLYGSLFFLTDESWALSIGAYEQGERDGAFLLGSGLALHGAWVGSTAAGYLAGAAVGNPAVWGLDFAFVAVFASLLTGLYRGRQELGPWAVAAAVAVVGHRALPGAWYILLAALAGTIVGVLRDEN